MLRDKEKNPVLALELFINSQQECTREL